jgi:hypothetical protein
MLRLARPTHSIMLSQGLVDSSVFLSCHRRQAGPRSASPRGLRAAIQWRPVGAFELVADRPSSDLAATGPASPEDTAATSELLWPASCRYAGDGMGRGERSPYGTHNPQSDPLRSLERVTLRHRHQDFAVDRVSVGQSVRRATAIPCSDAQTCFAVARCATAAANESG